MKPDFGWMMLAATELMFSKLIPWTPSQHRCFLPSFRLAVRELLLIHARLRRDHQPMEIEQEQEKEKEKEKEEETEGISFGSLPVMVLHVIFGHLARGYADRTLPDFLTKDLGVEIADADLVLQEMEVNREAPLFWCLIGYHSAWDLFAILGKQPEKIEGEMTELEEVALKLFKDMLRDFGLDTEGTPDEITNRLRAHLTKDVKTGFMIAEEMSLAELRFQLKLRGLDIKGDRDTLVHQLGAVLETEEDVEEDVFLDIDSMEEIYETLSVAELRNELKKFKKDTKGTKKVLIKRLLATVAKGRGELLGVEKKGEETKSAMEGDEEEERGEKESIDPSSIAVADLRRHLKARGLDTKGTKAVLIGRLAAALAKDEEREEAVMGEGEGAEDEEKREKGGENESINPSSMTVADLRQHLKARGLDTKGTKAVLIGRLTAALEEEYEEEGEKGGKSDEGGETSNRTKRRASQMKKSEEEKKANKVGQRETKRAPPRKKPTIG